MSEQRTTPPAPGEPVAAHDEPVAGAGPAGGHAQGTVDAGSATQAGGAGPTGSAVGAGGAVAAPSGRSTGRGNAASPAEIGAMFDRISGVYDAMNLVISGFQEPRWRRRAVAASGIGPGMAALDVATGTGKVAAGLWRRAQPGGRVLGVDLSPRMIGRATRSLGHLPGLAFVVGDALALPADDASVDAATIAFGMRNLPDYGAAFAEMRRVVRPGGRVVCLEISRPRSRPARLLAGWFDHVVPAIGRVVGQGDAYTYLVRSAQSYPSPDRIATIMAGAGLVDVRWSGMSGGIVTLHVGTVPADDR